MSTRSASIRITADTASAIRNIDRVGEASERAGRRSARAGIDTDRAWAKIGSVSRAGFIAGAAGLAILGKANIDFDRTMSGVAAATQATGARLTQLRNLAIKAGADTQYSATEAAQGITELSKAGVSAKDIMGGALRGALDLAAAGQIEVADAAEYTATALTQFGLKGNKATHVADLLAAGAGKAQGEVQDMALALNYAGVPAAQLGVSIEETAGTIALFAKNGIVGEKAGTTLRGMLASLTSPSTKASKIMEGLGINVFDAQGKFVGLEGVAGQLQKRLSGLTQEQRAYALGQIFGNAQLQGANVLYREGAKGVRTWTKNVNDAGFAADTAAKKTDNLAGDWERFTGSLESAFLKAGSGSMDGLRDIVQGAEKAVDWFNRLPSSVQEGTVKVAALGTVAAGVLWTVSSIVGQFRDVKGILGGGLGKSALRGGLGAAAAKAGPVPVIIMNPGFAGAVPGKGGVPPVVAGGTKAGVAAGAAAGASRAAVLATGALRITAAGAVTFAALKGVEFADTQLRKLGDQGNEAGALKAFDKPKNNSLMKFLFGDAQHTLQRDIDTVLGKTKFDKLNPGVGAKIGQTLNKGLFKLDDVLGGDSSKSVANVEKLDSALAELSNRDPSAGLAQWERVLQKSGASADQLARALPKTAEALGKIDPKLSVGKVDAGGFGDWAKQEQAIRRYGKVLKTVPKNIRSYVSTPGAVKSLDEMRHIIRQYKLTPKQIRTIMRLQGFSETQGRIMASGRAYRSLPKNVRTALKAETVKTMADVRRLQRQYGLTPKQKNTVMHISGVSQAIADARRIQAAVNAVRSKTVTIHVQRTGSQARSVAVAQADGGTVPGPRTPYGDKVLAYLAPGEEVITNRRGEADRYRADRAAGRIPAYADGGTIGRLPGIPGYADGGVVRAGAGVTIVFPTVAVTKAALVAAEGIAVATLTTTRSLREQRTANLEILRAQQSINQLQKSLNARRTVTTGKGKAAKKRSVLELTGIDRQVAEAELVEAKQALIDLKGIKTEVDALTEARTTSKTTLGGTVDLFARGASPASAVATVNRAVGEIADYGSVVARLKAAKASPALLRMLVAKAESGDFRSATRLGRALLEQPSLLGQLNTSLGALDSVTGSVAQLTTDPRFLSPTAWQAAPSTVVRRQVDLNVTTLDPSLFVREVTRLATHVAQAELAKLGG